MAFAALALLVMPIAHAQFKGQAGATMQVESNSNVFDVNSGTPLPAVPGDAHRGDTFLAYGALFGLQYGWRNQQFFASASASKIDYQNNTDLDHTAYKFDAGMKWALGRLLDGKIEISRARDMVPFYDLAGTTLSLQTVQREAADATLKVSPEWSVEGAAYTSKQNEPLPEAPNLSLTDTAGTVTVRYLGIARFTGGFNANYDTGSFQGSTVAANPDYHQYGAGLTTSYLSPRSTLEGEVGYSRRMSATGTDNTSGVTGKISLLQRLTAKTNVAFTLSRAIESYFLNSGS